MRPLNRAPIPSRAALALTLVLSSAFTGCARDAGHASLSGVVPVAATNVGGIALPEVRADRGDSVFHLRPQAGHVLIVYFGYTTCPDVCPTTLADLHRALARLGHDARRVEVAFVTVDIERDTPELLAPYLAAFVAGGHPLRPANPAQLALAEHAFGAASTITRNAGGEIEVSHTGTMYVVGPDGRIADEWSFGSSPEVMAHDLRILLSGAQG